MYLSKYGRKMNGRKKEGDTGDKSRIFGLHTPPGKEKETMGNGLYDKVLFLTSAQRTWHPQLTDKCTIHAINFF